MSESKSHSSVCRACCTNDKKRIKNQHVVGCKTGFAAVFLTLSPFYLQLVCGGEGNYKG